MSWVRIGSAFAAIVVHVAVLAVFVFSSMDDRELSALRSGGGKDDLTIAATVTMESEESLGLDAASIQRQQASAGGQAAPQMVETVRKEPDKIELPPEEPEESAPPRDKRKPEKKVEPKPATPAPVIEAQEEQRAATRAYEARRNEVLSQYNNKIYQALLSFWS